MRFFFFSGGKEYAYAKTCTVSHKFPGRMLSKSANSIYAINFEVRPLHFETLRLSATTTLLEFATLGDGIRLLVLVRAYRKNEHGQINGQNNDIPMPKCLYASREVLTPLNNTVLAPVGDRRAS